MDVGDGKANVGTADALGNATGGEVVVGGDDDGGDVVAGVGVGVGDGTMFSQ